MAYKFNPFTGKLEEYGPILTGTGTVAAAADGTEALPGISFANDLSVGIYRPGPEQLALSTNGTGRLFINSAGNISLNTTQATLWGYGNFTGGTTVHSLLVGQSDAFLGVAGSSTEAALNYGLSNALASPTLVAKIATVNTATTNNQERADLAFYTKPGTVSTVAQERLRITAAGLVGIGTSAPVSALCNTATAPPWSYTGGFIWQSSSANYATSVINTNAGAAYGLRVHVNDTSASSYPLFVSTGAGAGSARLVVNGAGNVGIGTTSVDEKLHVQQGGGSAARVKIEHESTGVAGIVVQNTNRRYDIQLNGSDLQIYDNTASAERARIDSSGNFYVVGAGTGGVNYAASFSGSAPVNSLNLDSSGRLLVGTSSSSAAASLILQGNSSASSTQGILYLSRGVNNPTDAQLLGVINFSDSGHAASANIEARRDGGTWTSGVSQPTRLVFSTTADGASSPTERMRIDSNGRVIYGSALSGSSATASSILTIGTATATGTVGWESYVTSTSTRYHASFSISGTVVGSISTNGSATAFNTSSDYRLKENVTPVTDGITRLQQLKPSRFSFITDPDKTVDGFIAHEVQTIVPEAITGEKDAVDDDGNPVYQGIDQSKLVPLLTAALQEAIAKIESLEARLTAAGL